MAIARRMTIRSNLVSSYNVVVLLRSQVDMIRCKSVKDEVKRHIDKIEWEVGKVKHERTEFKLKAARTFQELQKVRELPAS